MKKKQKKVAKKKPEPKKKKGTKSGKTLAGPNPTTDVLFGYSAKASMVLMDGAIDFVEESGLLPVQALKQVKEGLNCSVNARRWAKLMFDYQRARGDARQFKGSIIPGLTIRPPGR